MDEVNTLNMGKEEVLCEVHGVPIFVAAPLDKQTAEQLLTNPINSIFLALLEQKKTLQSFLEQQRKSNQNLRKAVEELREEVESVRMRTEKLRAEMTQFDERLGESFKGIEEDMAACWEQLSMLQMPSQEASGGKTK